MDVHIEKLRVEAVVGTELHERAGPQPILLNLRFGYDATRAARRDDLVEAVDYADLAERVCRHVKASRCLLLERLAEEVLDLLWSDGRIERAEVRIDKPGAIPQAETVAILARRDRAEG
jgi:FolB domain-containing protein